MFITDTKVNVLLVMSKAPWTIPPWAALATGGKVALDQWRARRYRHVFADFGSLGDGMSGSRLCASLRKEAGPDEVNLVLMSEHLQPHLRAWAQQSGASGVIVRSLEAILAEVAPGATLATAVAPPGTSSPREAQPPVELNAVVALVEARLQTHGHMGAAGAVVVADALGDFAREHPGQRPTAIDVALRVAQDIRSTADRITFLKSFEEGVV